MNPDYTLFTAIVDAGTLSAAARRLSMSPAMVSKRLARLERELGVRLLHRTTRMMQLTERGASFYAELCEICAHLEEVEARLRRTKLVPAGSLRITAPTSFGRLHLAPHLGDFLRCYPDIDLQIELSDAFADINAERFDVAIRITANPDENFAVHRLAGSRRILCATPAYIAANGMPRSPADLGAHRLLAADGQLPWLLRSKGRSHRISAVSHVRTNSSEVVRELALAGAGVSLRSLWDIADLLRDGRLVRVMDEFESVDELAIYALHPTGFATTAAAGAFVQFLRDLYAGAVGWDRIPHGHSKRAFPAKQPRAPNA